MARTAYVDETKRKHYLLCAVVVEQSDVAAVRRELRRIRGPHDGIHMSDRNERERLAHARTLARLPVAGILVAADRHRERDARDVTLERLVPHLLGLGVTRLVIESCGEDRADRQVLRRLVGPHPAVAYGHAGKSELMLRAARHPGLGPRARWAVRRRGPAGAHAPGHNAISPGGPGLMVGQQGWKPTRETAHEGYLRLGDFLHSPLLTATAASPSSLRRQHPSSTEQRVLHSPGRAAGSGGLGDLGARP